MFFVPAAQIKELDGLWLADRCPEYAWVARVVLPGLVWQDVSYGGESTRPALEHSDFHQSGAAQ
jgi:hypothetical protein